MTPSERPQTAAEARAEVEAGKEQARAARRAEFDAAYGDRTPGRWVIAASWASSAAFAAAAVGGVIWPDPVDGWFLILSLVLFALGSAVFMVDLVLAAARSRDDAMGIGGLFFLAGSAPPEVQRHLNGSLTVQIVVSLVAAGVGFARIDDRQLNSLAFGILVPMLALSLTGLWGVRFGLFPPRSHSAGQPVRRGTTRPGTTRPGPDIPGPDSPGPDSPGPDTSESRR